MGFDIECVIDIHSYPGEYFCPVCRTLVYPSEALQSQCTHLYCKPCLAHIANGSRACPYDGYLVTESESKPLVDTDKALAENIGKVKVHCLYFRSGCSWEGALSECTSHCSGCSFGNSPVICNRCGIQIVHRQVHDHAQTCPGVFQGQPGVGAVSGAAKSGTNSSTTAADVNQTVSQSGALPSQTQNPQNVAAAPLPGQNANQQLSANCQAPVVAPVTVPTPEQWYHQQYQQYYQQYMGYDPYQQATHQYYTQQYQQHPLHVPGQGLQSNVYPHSLAQPQVQQQPQPQPQVQQQPQPQGQQQPQPQTQTNHVQQTPQQLQLQPQAQGQAPTQQQGQMQAQPQAQSQMQVPPQGLASNYQVNLQQPPHLPMRPQSQIPSQTLQPPPHSQTMQPPPFSQATGMRPPAQNPQVTQYQQPHMPMHQPQAPQAHVQQQMYLQPQVHPQSSTQSLVQIQQVQPYHAQSQPPVFPPQANQSSTPGAFPQVQHPPAPPVSGHHSYQQPQPVQKIQSGPPQQHPPHPHPASGSLHPVQLHGQASQQPAAVQPTLHSHGPLPQQQSSTLFPPQNQNPGMHPAQQQQFPPPQQSMHPFQQRPVMQPVQEAVPQHYGQQQHFPTPSQNQLHQQGHFPQQQPTQPQLRPPGRPQTQQSQSHVGRPLVPNQVTHLQRNSLPSAGFGHGAYSGAAQNNSGHTSTSQNYAKPTVLDQNATVQDSRSPSKGLFEKGAGGDSVKEELGMGSNNRAVKDADNVSDSGLRNSVVKQEKEEVQGSLEQASGGKSSKAEGLVDGIRKEEGHLLVDSNLLKQADIDNQKIRLSTANVRGQASADFGNQPHTAVTDSSKESHVLPSQSHGPHQQRSVAQVQGQPPSSLGFQGPNILPHLGQSNTPTEARGVMGRVPPHHDRHFGSEHNFRPNEDAMSKDQMSGSREGGPPMKTYGDEQHFPRMNGGRAPDSSIFGSRDEKLKAPIRELTNPFRADPIQPVDHASRSLDKAPHGPNYDTGMKLDPVPLGPHSRFLPPHHPSGGHGLGPGPEYGQHEMKHFAPRSPDREYRGSSPRRFGEPSSFPHGISAFNAVNIRDGHRFGDGPRPFNLPSDPVGNPLRDGRFTPLSGPPRRGDIDGSANPGFGERVAPGLLHNHRENNDFSVKDGPGMRGEFSGPGYPPSLFMAEPVGPGVYHGHGHGHGRLGEMGGPGSYPRFPYNEPNRGDRPSFSHFGEAGMRNSYPLPGFPNAGNFPGGMGSFDQSRKRAPVSPGWCRICKLDCETVERLDMHSQTREHQKMAMDMVNTIKLQNKKPRTSAGHMMHEGGIRSRNAGYGGHGSKP